MTLPEFSPDLRIIREIGRGGMGIVYLAEDLQLERRVAVKTLPPHLASDAQVRQRFLREARTAAALSHPNIVPIYSAAERDGVVYFTMAYVHGESLAERLVREGAMAVDVALAIVRQLAQALHAAHTAGVVHRDIKSENVLLNEAGQALVTDFGIARVSETQPLTATGTVLGTVQYMSPEQVTGEALDGRSDLYALGVLLFHMLTLRFPFERASASAVLVAHVNSAPLKLRELAPHVPVAVEGLVDRLMAKRPDERVPSARVLLEWLDALARGERSFVVPVAGSAAVVPTPTAAPPVVHAAPASLSSADAQAVWARAAQLQANTGVIVPPPTFATPSSTDTLSDPLTRGYDAVLVKQAAAEAGIDAQYVERALAERAAALVPASGGSVEIRLGERQQKAPNWFLGAHTKLEFETTVAGEVDVDVFEDMADEARRVLGSMVTISAVGRTLTVNTGLPQSGHGGIVRTAQIQVQVRRGQTTIRAFEDVSQMAGGILAGGGAGVGIGLGAALMGVLTKAGEADLGIMAWLGTGLVGYFGARFFYRREVRKKEAQLRDLVERLARRAQGALPPATKFLP